MARPINCLLSGLSILTAAVLAQPIQNHMHVALAAIIGIMITAAANTINDYYDIEIDRINRPERVLPSARITPDSALVFSIILFVCAIFFSIFIDAPSFLLALISSFLLVLYSAKLKRTVLMGNILVAFVSGLAFLFGAAAANHWSYGLTPACLAFFFHLGREILKDLEDIEGDGAGNAMTLPVKYGPGAALVTITAVYTILIFVTFIPYYLQIYNINYLYIVTPGVNLVIVLTTIGIWKATDKKQLRFYSNVLKVDMIVGLIAIYSGR